MGNYTGNYIQKYTQQDLEKNKNSHWSMKKQVDENTCTTLYMKEGWLKDLGWEIEETKTIFFSDDKNAVSLDCKDIDVILAVDRNFVSEYCSTTEETVTINTDSEDYLMFAPIFICFLDEEQKNRIRIQIKGRMFTLRLKKTEKFLEDCDKVKNKNWSFHQQGTFYKGGKYYVFHTFYTKAKKT